MPLDAQPFAVLPPYEQAYVLELYARLDPLATEEQQAYILDRTRAEWQVQMDFHVLGTAQDPAMPAYEKGYVAEWYNQLLPRAQRAYFEFILERTPEPWQETMTAILLGVPLADAWKGSVISAGGSVSDAYFAAVKNFIAAETVIGVWDLLDDYWALWGENTAGALVSLKQRRTAINTGATFLPYLWFQFDGIDDVINTGFVPSTHAVAMNGNNQRLAVYEFTNVSANTYSAGAFNTGSQTLTLRARVTSNMVGALNAAAVNIPLAPADSRGYSVISRIGGVDFLRTYKNGVRLTDVAIVTPGTGLPTAALMIGAQNNNGAPAGFRQCNVGFVTTGALLSDAQELAHFANIEKFRRDVIAAGIRTYDFMQGALPANMTFARVSNGWYFDASGTLVQVGTNVPRFAYDPLTLAPLGILIENTRTNSLRNSTCVGAVVGTPGTLPTNWTSFTGAAGISMEIVGAGIEDGINYIDVRAFGTAAAASSFGVVCEASTAVSATLGQVWTGSMFIRFVGGSLTGITGSGVTVAERNNTGVFLMQSASGSGMPSSEPLRTTRRFVTRTLDQATVAFVTPGNYVGYANGATIDVTMRFGLPQLELGEGASSPIKTSTANVLRAIETLVINDPLALTHQAWGVRARAPQVQVRHGTLLQRDDNSGNNDNRVIAYRNLTGNTINGVSRVAAVNQCDVLGGVVAHNAEFAVACRWAQDDFSISLNGALPGTDTAGTLPPTAVVARVGRNALTGVNAEYWDSTIRRVEMRPTATDAELRQMSAP